MFTGEGRGYVDWLPLGRGPIKTQIVNWLVVAQEIILFTNV